MKNLKRLASLVLAFVFVAAPLPAYAARDWTTDGGPEGNGWLPEAPAAKTHSLRWSTKISDLPSGIYPMSPLLTYKGKVIVNGAGTNSVLALDTKTGEVAWRFQPDPRKSGSFGGYPNPQQPIIVNGIFYTTSTNGFIYALDAKTGKKIWSYQITGTDYNKIVGRIVVCNSRAFAATLGGIPSKGQDNIYALDAKTGKKLWSTYAGATDWQGEGIWRDAPKDPTAADTAALARNTRHFEAMFGMTCAGNRVRYHAEDGVLRFLDEATGEVREEYNSLHAGTDLGFQVDGAVNLTDSKTGDLLVASINNRLVRLLDPSKWADPCGKRLCANNSDEETKVQEKWRHPYGDCTQPGNPCGPVTVGRGEIVATHQDKRNDGVLGGATFTAGFSIVDRSDGKRVVYSPNHDGYLYIMDFDDPLNPAVFKKVPMDPIPNSLRDGPVSKRTGGESYYSSNDGSHCMTPANCQNGPWEHRASNVSSPLAAGGVVYVADSFAHKMLGFDYFGNKVWEYEIRWDDKAQYPPFGDTKPSPFIDLDEVVHTTPAHDGANLYFAAGNGVVYCFSTQENIAKPRKNLAILGSGIVPFIPKWKEVLGAFDYVWTPSGDWYKPSYTSSASTTAKQAAPAYPDAAPPFGYKGSSSLPTAIWPGVLLLALLTVAVSARKTLFVIDPLSLDSPLMFGKMQTLVESLDEAAEIRRGSRDT